MGKNASTGINQDLPHDCKYVSSLEVYDSCKYDDSKIVDVRDKENQINVKTSFVNRYDN